MGLVGLILAAQGIISTVKTSWGTAGRTVEGNEGVEGYHRLSKTVLFCLWTELLSITWLSTDIAWYWWYGLSTPESSYYFGIDAVKRVEYMTA